MISLISVMALSEISAQTNDTLRNIELPAALIRDTKQQTPDEKTPRIADKNLTKRINQGQDLPFLLNNLSSVVVSSDAGTGIGTDYHR